MKNINLKNLIIALLIAIGAYLGWDLTITPKEEITPVIEAVDTSGVIIDTTAIDTSH